MSNEIYYLNKETPVSYWALATKEENTINGLDHKYVYLRPLKLSVGLVGKIINLIEKTGFDESEIEVIWDTKDYYAIPVGICLSPRVYSFFIERPICIDSPYLQKPLPALHNTDLSPKEWLLIYWHKLGIERGYHLTAAERFFNRPPIELFDFKDDYKALVKEINCMIASIKTSSSAVDIKPLITPSKDDYCLFQ